MSAEPHKHCPRCHERKPFSDFPPAPSRPLGISSLCRPCHRDNMRVVRSTPEGLLANRIADRKSRERRRARLAAEAAAASSPDVAGEQPSS